MAEAYALVQSAEAVAMLKEHKSRVIILIGQLVLGSLIFASQDAAFQR